MPYRRPSWRTARGPGFTLVELLVVIIIVGILATVGLSSYSKMMESTRADEAVAITQAIANANRTWKLDHGALVTGNISDCNLDPTINGTCNSSGTGCDLIYCSYIARQDLRSRRYYFHAGDCSNGNTLAACCAHNNSGGAPYTGWGYQISEVGTIVNVGGAPEIR